MPKSLTKKDVENAFKGQSLLITRKIDRLREEVLTKKDAEKFITKDDAKQFATKEDLKRFATKNDLKESEKRILDGVKAMMEVRDDELQGKHQVELDRVAGKAETPLQWKSIPRRLTTVEMDVEKIKDTLEIS